MTGRDFCAVIGLILYISFVCAPLWVAYRHARKNAGEQVSDGNQSNHNGGIIDAGR